jgi:hypothetical protein
MVVPTVKVRPGGRESLQRTLEKAPASAHIDKGFISRCVEIVLEDAKDKLYRDRKRRREEYEHICELARGSQGRNGTGK